MESNLSQVVMRFLEHVYIVSKRNWNVNKKFIQIALKAEYN